MRQVVYNFLSDQNLGNFILVDHLPWEDNNAPLYHHNKKHIYVDVANTQQQSGIDALDQKGTVDEVQTVSVYFVNDAKRLPPGYDDVVEVIKGARLASGTEGFIQRTCQVSHNYIEDAIVTVFEFSFRKLLTN